MPSGGRRGDSIRTIAALAAAAALLIGLGAVAAQVLAARGIDISAMTQADVERFVAAWGAWSAAGSVALMVLHSFLPLPAELIPLVNGMMFGPWLGIALTWIGAMLGAVLSFALARWLGRPFVRLVVSEARWRQIATLPVRPGPLLLVRLVPLISFNLVNYAAGLLGVGWWTFLWTTAIGILPLTVAMVLVGGQILAAPLWAWALAAATVAALFLLWRVVVSPSAPRL
ncbi:MAG TPA: VTT domain-containing protein [Stellaceae bacterium]